MTPTADPAIVPGLPESRLTPEHLAALPTSVPPAPWECRTRALIWIQRAAPPTFGWLGRPTRLAMVAFVEYLDSPVGTYHEVLAGTLVRSGLMARLQVPFIAVDSLASVAGGRVNWALPKTVADFETDLETATARAEGDGWSVIVRPARAPRPGGTSRPDRASRRSLLRIPIRSRFSSIGPLGSYGARLRGIGHVVRVTTQVEGETLTGWLGGGNHLAIVLAGRMRVDEPHSTEGSRGGHHSRA